MTAGNVAEQAAWRGQDIKAWYLAICWAMVSPHNRWHTSFAQLLQPFLSFKSFNKNLFLFFVLFSAMGWGGYGKGGYGWGFPPMMMMPWGKARERPGFMCFQMILLFPCFRLHALKHEFCILLLCQLQGIKDLWSSLTVQGLRGFANEKKVWIGGLPAGPTSIETNKKLKEHMAQAETCRKPAVQQSAVLVGTQGPSCAS